MGKFEGQSGVIVRILAELEVIRMILTKSGVVSEADYDKAVDEVEGSLSEVQTQLESAFDCFDDDDDDVQIDDGKIHEA